MGNQTTVTELSALSAMVSNVLDMLVSMKKEEQEYCAKQARDAQAHMIDKRAYCDCTEKEKEEKEKARMIEERAYHDSKEKEERDYREHKDRKQQIFFTNLMANMQHMAPPNFYHPSTPNQLHLQPQTQIAIHHNVEVQYPQNTIISPPSGGTAQP